MFNLLPRAEKEAIRREYRMRLWSVILFGVCATFLIAALLLIPSLALSNERETAARERLGALSKRVEAGEVARFAVVLQEVERTLTLLRTEAPRHTVYEAVRAIVSHRPAGVSLDGITVTSAAGGKREIEVRGMAANRTALVAFSRALETTGVFERVELPLGNLARSEDVAFSLKVTASF
ncbi:MAG: hypothetical protein Greene041679_98 [Parcubacteria group bacterium Greene0416_79]|nr:MAG: hypothetical protein Greene041679_98 [Parcubacteria group bacterium Greene0416_79]